MTGGEEYWMRQTALLRQTVEHLERTLHEALDALEGQADPEVAKNRLHDAIASF